MNICPYYRSHSTVVQVSTLIGSLTFLARCNLNEHHSGVQYCKRFATHIRQQIQNTSLHRREHDHEVYTYTDILHSG